MQNTVLAKIKRMVIIINKWKAGFDKMNASFYNEIKEILISARNKVYQTANFAMVEAYWNIGKSIMEIQHGDKRAS